MQQLLLGKRKLLSPPLTSTPFTVLPAVHTRCCSRRQRSSNKSSSAGSSSSAKGVQWPRNYENPSSGPRIPEQIPSAPPAPLQQQSPIAEEGETTAGESASREGASSSRRMEDGRVEQQIRPRRDEGVTPGATRNTRGASGRTWIRGRGGAEGNHPTPSVSPGRADFGGINGKSSNSSSDDSRTSSGSSNSNDSGDLPSPVGRPGWDLEVSGELPAPQSGRTRSQSRGLTISVSYADAMLAYVARRAVEAKKTMEKKKAEIKRAHGSLLEEHLEKGRERLEKLERRGALLD